MGIARFEREVQMTCQLTHPNTIALYDYGRTDDGFFYYAMEYLEGLSLDRLVEEHRPPARGAGDSHSPAGVRLPRGSARRAAWFTVTSNRRTSSSPAAAASRILSKCSISVWSRPATEGQLELTAANATLGTPLYMSPEAVKNPNAVDARSDLYSLGSVGYDLLTGETVFCGLSLGEVMLKQVRDQPEPPSARMKRPVSSDLEDLLMRCLAKDPSGRPAGAEALGEALARCAASGAWTRRDAREWWNKQAAVQNAKTQVL